MKNLLWGLFAFAALAHAQGTVTDIDGNTYDYLTYGTLRWTVENAAMETYRDGTPIPQVTDFSQWINLTTGAWCYYDNDPTKGKLYNWYALAGIHDNDPVTPNKEFAPAGWRIPFKEEYIILADFLIESGYNYDNSISGNKIGKAMSSTFGWDESSEIGDVGNDQATNNNSGLNILPTGIRNSSGAGGWDFKYEGQEGRIWTHWSDISPGSINDEICATIATSSTSPVLSGVSNSTYLNKSYGLAVRFVQNSNTCSEVSINASATEVCAGESVDLTVSSGLTAGTAPSCYGSTNQIFTDWTELAPNAEYVNIIKHNNIYYLRSNNDVLQSNNINGSWVSMNFQNQIGHQCSPIATLFDFDWADRLHVATLHNSLYAYENGNWINNGLSGFGCSGRALTRLANNRIIVSKWGYLRDLYISDDNGSNWTNVTNVNNDYRDIIVADNGNVFACGGSNTASMTGLIKSTDNGNSFFNVSSELGINYASTLSDDCEGNLYVLADNSIYKSSDEGESWVLFSNTPFNSTVSYSFLLPISSDVLFLFGRNANEIGLYESNNGGATWHELTNPLSDLNTIREFKLVDNVLVILTDEGVFGKTIEFSTSTFLWSTGDTTANISVTPTETTEYWVDVTTNGVTCREYVTIDVTAPAAPTGDAEQTFCNAATVADLIATGDNIQWYDAATGGNLLNSTTVLTDGQMVYASQTVNGCESTDRLEVTVSIQDITITASATEVCAGESVDLTVSSGLTAGTTACTSADLPANLQTGLVGYWPFCGNANDESENNNDGSVINSSLTSDRFLTNDNAYLFVQNTDRIIIPPSTDYDSNIISVSFWVNPYQIPTGYSTIIKKGTYQDASNEAFIFDLKPTQNGFGQIETGYKNNTCVPNLNWVKHQFDSDYSLIDTWTNYVITIDSNNNQKLFQNGILISQTTLNANFSFCNGGELSIGSEWNNVNRDFYGKIDDVAIWNRVLNQYEIDFLSMTNSTAYLWSTGDTSETISVTPTETTEYWVDVTTNGLTCREYVTINVTAPAAPTGDTEQTFCDAATVADLTATGDNIQWYDAATGGNLLDSATALTDGQMLYASQTVNGCESTDRLEVTVSIQDITITASATEVCAGESVDLSVVGDINSTYLWSTGESNFSGQGTLIDEYSLIANTVSQNTFSTIPGNIYRLEVSGTISLGGGAGNQRDVAYYIQSGSDGTIEGTPFDSACNLRIWTSLFCDTPGLRPSPDIYDASTHTYNYPFNANSSTLDVGFWDSPLSDNGPNVVTFKLYELSNSESTITVSPTETTEYWVDVTTNGVTCREYVTITVNDLPEAPTGESVNYFINCDSFSPTLNDVIATLTGGNIKLYDAAVGGNLLDPNSNIIDGQVVYASQTLDSCESSDRLEVQLNLYTLDTPVTAAPNNTVSFCNEQNLTILDLAPAQTATDRLWYETATSTTPIAETTPLVDGVTYYVSNHDIETGCESDRLAMTVEINNPEAPTGDTVQSFCDNVTVSDLSASGSNIQWYDAATGGNVLDPGSALSDGQVLYASQTENSCESVTRLEVSVEIDIIPDPILITTELEFCLAREATLTDLEVDEQGFALEWYDSFSGGNMLPMDTLLEDGVSYYATLYDAASGCESLMRLEVVPTVIPCEVVIYNAISLNDNGMNDYMVIENAEYFPDNSLEIYNRDGHLLYSQTQYGIGDNLFRGIANVSGIYGSRLYGDGPRLPTGSYLYVFKYFNPYEQQEYTLKGFLTINSN